MPKAIPMGSSILLLLATWLISHATAQNGQLPNRAPVVTVRGIVTRRSLVFLPNGSYKIENRPEVDARVFLCVDAESTCDRGGNAVTDTTGSFLVAPRQLIADKKYILVIRPIGGSDARKALGSAQDISKIREPILIELRGKHIDALTRIPTC